MPKLKPKIYHGVLLRGYSSETYEEWAGTKAKQKYHHVDRETGGGWVRWKLVHDPIPYEDGGIQPGALFDESSVAYTLALGNWAEGTLLEKNGHCYTVQSRQLLRDDGQVWEADGGWARIRETTKKRLSPAQVQEIMRSYTGKRGQQAYLAEKYGVSAASINQIIRHERKEVDR